MYLCGNGSIDASASEACDDGNATSGDGCSDGCIVEAGYECPSANNPCVKTCGNGVDNSEACDDGNDTDGDGCSSTCTIEPGYICPTFNALCTLTCSDGI